MKKSILISIIFLVSLGVFVFFNTGEVAETADTNVVWRVGEEVITLDIADTPESRRQGLSGRESLDEDKGLLFVMERPSIYGFWMKDMNFPIDILWLDRKLKVVHIETAVSPNSYPRVYRPTEPALYVIEVNAGKANKLGVNLGEKLDITGLKQHQEKL